MGLIFTACNVTNVAYQVWRPTNNCHQIAQTCIKSHIEFGDDIIPRTPVGWKLCSHTSVPDRESEKVATLACTRTETVYYNIHALYILTSFDDCNAV